MPEILSVVIPAYNEERFVGELIQKVLSVDLHDFGLEMEVIVVDDGSRDRTAEIASAIPGVRCLRQQPNQGKGAAVRAGIAASRGHYVMIQDADLEYEPADYLPMLRALQSAKCEAVYGSRYLGTWLPHPSQSWTAYAGGRSLSLVAWLATGRLLTDTVTALKLFRAPVLQSLTLTSSGFELDHELTAKVLARGGRIVEVPIRYFPRSKADGKKIGARDWLIATRTLFRFRHG